MLVAVPVGAAIYDPAYIDALPLLGVIIVAMITDFVDGKVARKLGTASPSGQLFDHVTDCIFVVSGLLGAALAGLTSIVLPILVVCAFLQYVFDSYFVYGDKQLRMNFLGRWNGILYFVPIFLIVVSRQEVLSAVYVYLITGAKLLVYILTLTTVASIVDRAIAPLRSKVS